MSRSRVCLMIQGLAALVLAACGGGDSEVVISFQSDNGVSDDDAGGGTLVLELSDAPADDCLAVYVTIDAVRVHQPGGEWRLAAAPGTTVNLLELAGGVREQLGASLLEAGRYTQMRLLLGETADSGINILSERHPFANYVIDTDLEYHRLTIPSGESSGVKIVHPFVIASDRATELVLDFDAARSVVKAGKSGKWLLKPKIEVVATDGAAYLTGTVGGGDGAPLAAAAVSAQVVDPDAADPKDRVRIQAATFTNEAGLYTLLVQPGSYCLVAAAVGFGLKSAAVDAAAGGEYDVAFVLEPAPAGVVAGGVVIAGGSDEQHATLSFRQEVPCPGDPAGAVVEAGSLNIANGASYSLSLPAGIYQAVASVFGRPTQVHEVTVEAGSTTDLDITF